METQPRQAHVLGLSGDVQSTQDQAESLGMLGLDAGSRSTEEESFQALVPESQDRHPGILTRNVTGYNRSTVICCNPARLSRPLQGKARSSRPAGDPERCADASARRTQGRTPSSQAVSLVTEGWPAPDGRISPDRRRGDPVGWTARAAHPAAGDDPPPGI